MKKELKGFTIINKKTLKWKKDSLIGMEYYPTRKMAEIMIKNKKVEMVYPCKIIFT